MYKDAIYMIITQRFEESRELCKRKKLAFSSNYGDIYLN